MLGETLDASGVDYHDCEQFQIVCPACREPVFKGVRQGGETSTHYLAHYAASRSYAGDCELRVGALTTNHVERENRSARDQRLRYFLSVFTRTLGAHKMYTDWRKTHYTLEKGFAFRELRDLLFSGGLSNGLVDQFDVTADDATHRIEDAGSRFSTTFSKDIQTRIARDMWTTLCTPSCRTNFEFLFGHAWLIELQSWMASISQESEVDAEVSQWMLFYMKSAMSLGKADGRELLGKMTRHVLPEGFNRILGSTNEDPTRSTYLTRITGNVVIEMVSTLLGMPYFEMLKFKFGDPSKIFPSIDGVVPISEGSAAK